MVEDYTHRLCLLEEKFEYQDRTIDSLNEVIIDQQKQLDFLSEKIEKLEALLAAIEDAPPKGEEPPPPHY